MVKIPQHDFSVSGPENLAWAQKWLIPDIIITLKKQVKSDALKKAVLSALELHPLYQTMLTQNERSEPIRVKNTKSPIIKKFNRTEHILYGTKKYNNFSWLIRYTNKKIIISISHMLSDGTGAFNFIKSVLQFYFEETGDLPLNTFHQDSRLAYTTTENAYLKYGQGKTAYPQDKPPEIPATKIMPNLLVPDKEHLQTYRLVIEKSQIKKLSSQFKTRPFTIISALLARALDMTTRFQSGSIQIPVPVNCRNYFPSDTDRNFMYVSLLTYDISKMKKASLKSVAQEFNRQFQETTTRENMISMFRGLSDLTGLFKTSVKTAWGIRKSQNQINNNRTATICYSHLTHLNLPSEFDALIENIEASALPPRNGSVVYIFGLNFQNKITFSIQHIFKKNEYIKNLTDILKASKIDFNLSKSRHRCLAKFYTVK